MAKNKLRKFAQMETYPHVKQPDLKELEKGYEMKGLMKIKGTEKEVVVNFTYADKTFVGRTIIYSNDFDVFSRKKREDSKVLVKITIPVL